MENNLIAPYADNHLVYDYEAHRYYLTEQAVLDILGVNLGAELNFDGTASDSIRINRTLKKSANVAYNWLEQNSANAEWQEWVMAVCQSVRKRLKDVLIAQLEYVLDNGYIAGLSGINGAKGTAMDIRQLRGNTKIADEVETFGNLIIPEIGSTLLTARYIPFRADYDRWRY